MLGKIRTQLDHSAIAKNRESAMRRYFYDTLASYLSLYIRPEDQVIEIEPRSKDLGERFANYKAVSSVAALKTIEDRRADYVWRID